MEYILMNKNYALAHVKLSIDGHIDNILDIYIMQKLFLLVEKCIRYFNKV